MPFEHFDVQVFVILSARKGEQFVLHANDGSRYEPTGQTYTQVLVTGSLYRPREHVGEHILVFGSAYEDEQFVTHMPF